MRFTAQENRVLTEIERRLRYFRRGNDGLCLLMEYPSVCKTLVEKGVIKPSYGIVIPKQLAWYSLTKFGKELFPDLSPISSEQNESMFGGGMTINFNKRLKLLCYLNSN